MAPQARIRLPPELQVLTKGEMAKVIEQANVGTENEKIARLYSWIECRKWTSRRSFSSEGLPSSGAYLKS